MYIPYYNANRLQNYEIWSKCASGRDIKAVSCGRKAGNWRMMRALDAMLTVCQ